MTCKTILVDHEFYKAKWDFGLGSIYLCGKHHAEWKKRFLLEFEKTETSAVFLNTQNNFAWEDVALSTASVIVFYIDNDIDPKSCSQFGKWVKNERVFYGRNPSMKDELKYFDWLYFKEQKMRPSKSIGELVDSVTKWLKE